MKIRGEERKQVYIPDTVQARWSEGNEISRDETIVFDYMPILLGNQFRTDETLSKMLFRDVPVSAPLMLANEAYKIEGMNQLKEGNIIAALEAYKLALDAQTGFITAISRLGNAALLASNESNTLRLKENPLEGSLMREVNAEDIDVKEYGEWIEGLRNMRKEWYNLNHNSYGSKEYAEASLRLGKFREATYSAEKLGDEGLIDKINRTQPKEILNIDFLDKYIEDNFPESTMGRGRF